MPTEEDLEQRISRMLDEEYPEMAERMEEQSITKRVRDAILKLEIENLEKAVEQCENVSGFSGVQGKGSGA